LIGNHKARRLLVIHRRFVRRPSAAVAASSFTGSLNVPVYAKPIYSAASDDRDAGN
jgi:hypothetical protein